MLYLSVFLATPHPGGFKCFTCEDAEDNYSCNRWAPDKYCPRGTHTQTHTHVHLHVCIPYFMFLYNMNFISDSVCG